VAPQRVEDAVVVRVGTLRPETINAILLQSPP
jgi:hypothetical protein